MLHRRGQGQPFFFQHGLCGDHNQTFESAPDLPDWGLMTLDCPGHGGTPLLGPVSIAAFADAVAVVTPPNAVIGGISMGAAIATRLAVQGRARALVLVRPAWVTEPAPSNMAAPALVGQMIAAGKHRLAFLETDLARDLARLAPDNLTSLTRFFSRPPLPDTARLLTQISADGPGITDDNLRALRLPTLICATGEDVIHPIAHAQRLADLIPDARLVHLPPKGRDKPAHLAALRAAIADFLKGL